MDSRRVRRTLDILAYASLILDICIAVITTFSVMGNHTPQQFLVPVNYLLTLVVILSIALFLVLVLLKITEQRVPIG